jgi:O-acetyl-ADP-ribose deacetylase (regulator of RNase III)
MWNETDIEKCLNNLVEYCIKDGIMGAGVAGAIRRAGGKEIEYQAKQLCVNNNIQPFLGIFRGDFFGMGKDHQF